MPVSIAKPPGAKPNVTPGSQTVASFMKTGAAAKAAIVEADAQAEMRREAAGKALRFYIGKKDLKKDFEITFLDGDVDAAGELCLQLWHEHVIEIGGKPNPIVCLAPDYCPACNLKDSQPAVVAGFTIVDHTPYTFSKGTRQGETEVNKRKLYVAKRASLGLLQKYAAQYGGLRGMKFVVSRSTDRTARVGDIMMPVCKYDDNELQEMMGKDKEGHRQDLPFDYTSEAPFFPAEKMVEMGIGVAGAVVGKTPTTDLSNKL